MNKELDYLKEQILLQYIIRTCTKIHIRIQSIDYCVSWAVLKIPSELQLVGKWSSYGLLARSNESEVDVGNSPKLTELNFQCDSRQGMRQFIFVNEYKCSNITPQFGQCCCFLSWWNRIQVRESRRFCRITVANVSVDVGVRVLCPSWLEYKIV